MKGRTKIWMIAGFVAAAFFIAAQGKQVGARQTASYDEDDMTEPKLIYQCSYSVAKTLYHENGKAIQPAVVVRDTDEAGGIITLRPDVDYRVTYENNVHCGVGRIIIVGMGNYTGYHIEKFGIVPGKVKGVKVKSPFSGEATVTWKKVKGADGFYVYRKKAGKKKYAFIANITDGNYQVFHDKSKSLKTGKKYTYKIVPYVADPNYEETKDGLDYVKPSENSLGDYYYGYTNSSSYYGSYNNMYYNWYSYSCIKGRCISAFESDRYGTASGRATKKATKKRYKIYTGDAELDYMAYRTNKKIIRKGMGTQARVTAIYNWMVKHCTFTKEVKSYSKLKKMKCYFKYYQKKNRKKCEAFEKKAMKQIYTGKALCIGSSWHNADRATVALAYRKGSCSYLTPMFNILCNEAGVEAYIVDGYYVNRDRSKSYHNWSFVKIGKKAYWFDVPVACQNKNVKSSWFKKGTKFWKTCHQWSKKATKGYSGLKFQK